jgi:predicted membrane channel-forming protein YqfA (hemolysin III family)
MTFSGPAQPGLKGSLNSVYIVTMSASPNDGLPSAPPVTVTESKVPPPGTITASFWLYLIGAVVGIIGGILVFSDKQRIIDAVHKSNPNLTDAQLHDTANVATVIALAFAIIAFLLYLLFAAKLRSGRNWARIVLTILVILNVLSLVTNKGTMGVEYVGTVLSVIATILAYLPASNAYIKATKARR